MIKRRFAFALALAAVAGFWAGYLASSNTAPAFIAAGLSRVATSTDAAEAGAAFISAELAARPNVEEVARRIEDECRRGAWRRTKEWEMIFSALSADELGRLVSMVRALVLSPAQEELRLALLTRWGECAPAAVMAFLDSVPLSAMREKMMLAVVKGWLFSSPSEAISWIRGLSRGALKNQAIDLAIAAIAGRDRATALSLAELLSPSCRSSAYALIFASWATGNPAEAAAYAAKLDLRPADRHAVLEAIARAWVTVDPRAAITWAGGLPPGTEKIGVFTGIMSQWASISPKSAAQYALGLPAGAQRAAALGLVALSWSSTDPKGAADLAEKLPEGEARDEVLRSVAGNWANLDADAAATYAASLPDGPLKSAVLSNIGMLWALDAPEDALLSALTMPASPARTQTLGQIIDRLAQTDAAAAAAYVEATPAGTERDTLLQSLSISLASVDPELAASYALQVPGELQRSAVEAVTGALAQLDTEKAKAWIATLPDGKARADAFLRLGFEYVRADPVGAANWMLGVSAADGGSAVLDRVMSVWASDDTDAAMEWAKRLPEGPNKMKVIGSIGTALAYSNPAGGVDLALKTADPAIQKEILNRVASFWARQDSEAAIARASLLPPGPSKDEYVNTLVMTLSESSAARAADFVAATPAGGVANSSVVTMLENWSREDPASAAAWLTSNGRLVTGAAANDALRTVVEHWALADPAKTEQWIAVIPNGDRRDGAVATYVRKIALETPAKASRWVDSIRDPAARKEAIEAVAQSWLPRDREKAGAWLGSVGAADLIARF